MSYKDLEIWQLARQLTVKIHRMALDDLPAFELHEEGGQIRRSIKTVKSTIVEGYGRRRYKQDFIKFVTNILEITVRQSFKYPVPGSVISPAFPG